MGTSPGHSATPSLGKAPLLFWRMDLLKRSFAPLNHAGPPFFAKEHYRFFKDHNYRDKVLLPADLNVVNDAFLAIKQRRAVNVMFRAIADNETLWFKLTGWPVDDHRFYEGCLEDISGHISRLHEIFLQRGKRLTALEGELYPVAIFRRQDKLLVKHNEAFARFINTSQTSRKKFRLDSLIAGEVKSTYLEERLLIERQLTETLALHTSPDETIQAVCLLKSFDHDGLDLIRFGVVEILQAQVDPIKQEQARAEDSAIEGLCARFEKCSSVTEMLETIYAHRDLLPGLDAIMYSDIYARKNSVYVYASGALFKSLKPGSAYPYSGTIAENIEKENLEYLLVDDTHASIKAIDWALFVPHSVESYIAKALYSRGAMRTVLIFCSGRKQAFHDRQADLITRIATAFHRRLRHVDIP